MKTKPKKYFETFVYVFGKLNEVQDSKHKEIHRYITVKKLKVKGMKKILKARQSGLITSKGTPIRLKTEFLRKQ